MIISIPPLKPEDEITSVQVEDEPLPVVPSNNPLQPADGLRISEDQYIGDMDEWFRTWSDFEDMIKIK